MELDRISNLPDAIIDHILFYLPIKDGAKTSLLSSKWRYKWETVPRLAFDGHSLPVFNDSHGMPMTDKLVSDIDRVLLLHSGPICKFLLYYHHNLLTNDIDKWILQLSGHPIYEFVLWISNTESYKMPSCIFSWRNLTHLVLTNCFLKPPSTFKGFKRLKSLTLLSFTLDQDVFDILMSNCTMLEKLVLICHDGVDHLNINAPNLQSFNFIGPPVDVTLKNTSRLAKFYILTYHHSFPNEYLGSSGNLI